MRALLLFACIVPGILVGAGRAVRAADTSFASTDHVLCDMATSEAERETGVPNELLTAISRVEAGHRDPDTGATTAWPWTIDVEGHGHFYRSKDEAIEAVRAFQANGARSIDIGCMQVNLLQHPDAFASLSDAFDPRTNALWAARFLTGLFRQTRSWPHAAAAYHSMTPEIGADYQDQVLRMWAEGDGAPPGREDRPGNPVGRAAPAMASITDGEAASPFGADYAPVVASRYKASGQSNAPGQGNAPGQSSGNGRSLAAYRALPIAMASRPLLAARFRGS